MGLNREAHQNVRCNAKYVVRPQTKSVYPSCHFATLLLCNPATLTMKRNWIPYWLILPTVLYLALFFAYPMARGLILSIWDDDVLLLLQSEPNLNAPEAAQIPQNTQVEILGQQGNLIPDGDEIVSNLLTERWFQIEAEDVNATAVSGWVAESRIRVREEAQDGTPVMGTVRRRLGSGADPLTSVYAEPSEDSAVVGQLEARTETQIVDSILLELWFQVRGEESGQVWEGWAPSRFIQVFGDESRGRIDRGNTGKFTLGFFEKMVSDRFFWPSVRTTLLLMVIIIPTQFVLAIVMALVVQARLSVKIGDDMERFPPIPPLV